MRECNHKIVLASYDSIGGVISRIEENKLMLYEYDREIDEETKLDEQEINYCPICGRMLGE